MLLQRIGVGINKRIYLAWLQCTNYLHDQISQEDFCSKIIIDAGIVTVPTKDICMHLWKCNVRNAIKTDFITSLLVYVLFFHLIAI